MMKTYYGRPFFFVGFHIVVAKKSIHKAKSTIDIWKNWISLLTYPPQVLLYQLPTEITITDLLASKVDRSQNNMTAQKVVEPV